MANKPNNIIFPEKQTWGTQEELLLACAVHRHGTENWSSVALEVQKRSSALQLLITPLYCQQKYHDLRRRFCQNDDISLTDDNRNDAFSWLDELKKLRVAELKRELERYDLSIVSLQLKVKRLTEDREQSSIKNEPEKSDQVRTIERTGEEKEIIENNEPESLTGNPDSGEESDREDRSVNESNSTDPKAEEEGEKEPELVDPVPDKPELVNDDVKLTAEDSCNGSSGRVASRISERVDSAELAESIAESKDDGNKERESSSDVQSAVSLSRKEEEKSEEPDEQDSEDQSPATILKRRVSVESQPLIESFEIIRSHKFVTLFERLDIKETPNYITLIRQHMDLETIRTRLEENWYSGCYSSFFHDLLLLFNNAIVFFGKKSSEFIAAMELRRIVLKELAQRSSNSNSSLKEESLASPPAQSAKLELESSDSLLSKQNILIPLIACRKRSSITAKRALSASSGGEKKKEETPAFIDKNSAPDAKKHDQSSVKTDNENSGTKKRTRERSASSTRSSRKKGKSLKTLAKTKTKKSSDANANAGHSSEADETGSDNSETEAGKERKNKERVNAKKRSAASFLSRMKRSSPSKNDSLLETLKSSVISSEKGRGEKSEQKNKNGKNGKVDRKKEQIKQTRSGGKHRTERESPAKRNGERPARRAAGLARPVVPATRGKRRRDSVETEGSSLGRARKRSKK